jgi:hypothetical protein
LLRAILWVDSIKLKERCGNNFSTVVYFYEYNTKSLDLKSEQATFSKKLGQVKEKLGNKIILIPIAGNLNISSIDYLKYTYNVTTSPTILIDEKFKIETIADLDKIESYIK